MCDRGAQHHSALMAEEAKKLAAYAAVDNHIKVRLCICQQLYKHVIKYSRVASFIVVLGMLATVQGVLDTVTTLIH